MNARKWLNTVAISSFGIVLIVGIFNFIVDPFYQYRLSTFYPIAYISKLERYINPGLAKNYDYDSIVLGSSTSENFVLSDVKNILGFKKPIKFCISGTSAYEEGLILKTALENKKVKNVLYGLDPFLFWGATDRVRHGVKTFPFYLYDNGLLNDYRYLFSLDTISYSLKALLRVVDDKNKLIYDFNRMYQWQQTVPKSYFSKQYLLNKWKEYKNKHSFSLQNDFQTYKKSFDVNFLSLIKAYPKTNFIIYFPPYSILALRQELEEGVFEERLQLKKYIFEVTKHLENVQVFNFQIAKNIVYNLNNYHDFEHFHQKINKWMLVQIRQNHYLLNNKNIDSILKRETELVKNFKIKEK